MKRKGAERFCGPLTTPTATPGISGIVAAAAIQDWPAVRNLISQNGRRGYRPPGIDLGIEYPDGALVPDGTEPVPRHDPINNYIPNARPGSRAPHVVLEDGRSILDLFGPGFTLLTAETAPSPPPECAVHVLPKSSEFASLYGLERGGCVLVRPDGYVAARWRRAPSVNCIEQALAIVLSRSAA